MVTMFLPEHKKTFTLLDKVLQNCLLLNWDHQPALLFKGVRSYKVKDRHQSFMRAEEVCLYQLPRIMNGMIVFDCLHPQC